MDSYGYLLAIAVILLSTKALGLLSQRVHMPQVVGALLAGILLGPAGFGILGETEFLTQTAEIGVIILMFMAGLDTELKELKSTGAASVVVAILGVVIPLLGGWAVYEFVMGGVGDPLQLLKGIFVGTVLTATSVSITVETLREMGKLKTRFGTVILGAAIIDDILGILVLTVVTSLSGNTGGAGSSAIGGVLLKLLLYFVFVGLVGFVAYKIFKKMVDMWGEKRRISIYGFAFCLLMSFAAEHFFGVADITGAYFAGLILCNIGARSGIAKKMTVPAYLYFSPIFFASVGLKTTLTGMTGQILLFAGLLLIVAIASKAIGGFVGAKMFKFPNQEAIAIGMGMVSRGEVALIVAQKGLDAGLISDTLMPAIVIVVIITTLITPILLKMTVPKDDGDNGKKSKKAVASAH